MVGTAFLRPSAHNARGPEKLDVAALAANIAEAGILQPLIVRPLPRPEGAYEVVAGNRRLAAAVKLQLDAVSCRVLELTDDEAADVQLIENLQREDLTPFQEADSYGERLARPGATTATVAHIAGRTVRHVVSRLRLRHLVPEARKLYEAGALPLDHCLALALFSAAVQYEVLKQEVRTVTGRGGFDAPDAQGRHVEVPSIYRLRDVLAGKTRTLADALWALDSATLLSDAGACTACAKATNNAADPGLFAGIVRPKDARCTDGACWMAKLGAFYAAALTTARQQDTHAAFVTEATEWTEASAGLILRKEVHVGETWRPAGAGACTYRTLGVVVVPAGRYYGGYRVQGSGRLKAGTVLPICLGGAKCKTHMPRAERDRNFSPAEKRAATLDSAKRKQQNRDRAVRFGLYCEVMRKLAAAPARAVKLLPLVVPDLMEHTWHDTLQQMCRRRTAEATGNPLGKPRFEQDALAQEFRKARTLEQAAVLLLEIGAARYSEDAPYGRHEDVLLALAKPLKVDVKAVRRELEAKHAKKAKAPKAKKGRHG